MGKSVSQVCWVLNRKGGSVGKHQYNVLSATAYSRIPAKSAIFCPSVVSDLIEIGLVM
jgi:hypothetical protein